MKITVLGFRLGRVPKFVMNCDRPNPTIRKTEYTFTAIHRKSDKTEPWLTSLNINQALT